MVRTRSKSKKKIHKPNKTNTKPSHKLKKGNRFKSSPSRNRSSPSRKRSSPSRNKSSPSRNRSSPSRNRQKIKSSPSKNRQKLLSKLKKMYPDNDTQKVMNLFFLNVKKSKQNLEYVFGHHLTFFYEDTKKNREDLYKMLKNPNHFVYIYFLLLERNVLRLWVEI